MLQQDDTHAELPQDPTSRCTTILPLTLCPSYKAWPHGKQPTLHQHGWQMEQLLMEQLDASAHTTAESGHKTDNSLPCRVIVSLDVCVTRSKANLQSTSL